MDDGVRAELGVASRIIDELGLPTQFADWFQCWEQLAPLPDAQGKVYSVDGEEQTIKRAVAIGQSEFGVHVVDCDTGCLVYVDSAGDTQLINTSIEQFLQFIAHFNRAANQRFKNDGTLRRAFEEIDGLALRDAEGVWAVMLEGAETGLF